MLSQTFEFLRIVDVQPSDEKVRKRKQSATDLLAHFDANDSQDIMLALLQGIVAAFDGSPFSQDSPAVVLLLKTIKDHDAAVPNDLKENAVELRAVAAIVIGELLTRKSESAYDDEAVVLALALRSALSLRPASKQKHIKWALDKLLSAADDLLRLAGSERRKRGTLGVAGARQDKGISARDGFVGSSCSESESGFGRSGRSSGDGPRGNRDAMVAVRCLFRDRAKAAGRTLAVCCRILLRCRIGKTSSIAAVSQFDGYGEARGGFRAQGRESRGNCLGRHSD